MHLCGAQGGIGRVGYRHFHRLVGLIQRVVRHGDSEIPAGFSRVECQGTRSQGVVGAAAGGGTAGDRVVHRHRPSRLVVQGDGDTGGGRSFSTAGGGGAERQRGRIVIVLHGVCVNDGGAQGDILRTAQGNLDGFVGFVQIVVDDAHRDILAGIAGGKGQGARSQGIVHPAAAGGTAGDGVVHGGGLARYRRQRNPEGNGGCGFRTAGSGGVKIHRHCLVIVLDGIGVDRGGAQGGVVWTAQGDLDRFVILVQPVILHRHGDGLTGVSRAEGQGA